MHSKLTFAAAVFSLSLQAVAETIPAGEYVQEGLIGFWDGIENAGVGQHNSSAAVWKNLVGGGPDLTLEGIVEWEANALKLTKGENTKTTRTCARTTENVFLSSEDGITVEYFLRNDELHDTMTLLTPVRMSWTEQGWINASGMVYPLRWDGQVPSGPTITEGTPFHAGASVQGGATGLIVNWYNGEFQNSKSLTSVKAVEKPLTLFAQPANLTDDSTCYSVGRAYAVRLYGRALSAQEIALNAAIDRVRFLEVSPAEALPEGYRYEATLRKIQVWTKASFDGQRGSVSVDGTDVVSGNPNWKNRLASGETVLTATPASGFKFLRWEGDVMPAASLSETISVSCAVPVAVRAVFVEANRHGIDDYVQDGLVLHFDGICNAGKNTGHDPEATTWKELSGHSSDGTISVKQGGWQQGSFFRSGPDSSSPGYGTTSYLEYHIARSFVDNLNAGGGYTLDLLTHFIGDSASAGQLYSGSCVYLSSRAEILSHRGVWAGANNQKFPALTAADTNTVATVYDGGSRFCQYRNAKFVKEFINSLPAASEAVASTNLVKAFSNGIGGYGTSLDLYALRIYERPLSEKEIVQNARTDDERFFGSNVTFVVEVRSDYGTPYPAAGVQRVLPGSGFEIEEDAFSEGTGSRIGLTGWTWQPDQGEARSGTGKTAEIGVAADGVFTWRWKRQYEVSVTAGEGGSVKGTYGWCEENARVTISAVPSAGYKFLGWSGILGEGVDVGATTIEVLADRARQIRANFCEAGHVATKVAFALKGTAGEFDWNDPAVWGGTLPGEGDEVVIEGEKSAVPVITVEGPLPIFKSVTVKYATVNFKGWYTALQTTEDVTLSTSGVLTHAKASADLLAAQNRVWVVCRNLTISGTGAAVNVNEKGWPGVQGSVGLSPVATAANHSGSCGGAYGGLAGTGGGISGDLTYGSVEHPRDLGASGSAASKTATPGCGGGAVLIEASGTVSVGGSGISAVGGNGNSSGGGSGGSIDVLCETIVGSGTLSVVGGKADAYAAGGSGGRIAIHCDNEKQDLLGYSTLALLASPGAASVNGSYCFGGNNPSARSEHGTVYLSTASLLNTNVNVAAQVYFPEPELSVPMLNVPSGYRLEFSQDGFQLQVAGDVTLNGASGLVLGGEVIQYFTDKDAVVVPRGARRVGGTVPVKAVIGGNLTMAGSTSEIVIYPISSGAALDGNGSPAGAVLEVGKTLTIKSGATLYPMSSGTNGISCAIRARNLDVQAGAFIKATGRGYFGGCADNYDRLPDQTLFGYTGAEWYSKTIGDGGSHGGLGGRVTDDRALYGDERHPVLPGAGCNMPNGNGLNGTGGSGGGLIHLEIQRTATIHGTLETNGRTATGADYACAAAGGGIYLKTKTLMVGVDARMYAKGGNSKNNAPGAGGGGRIAIWRQYDAAGSADEDMIKSTVCSVAGGAAKAEADKGKPGTLFIGKLPSPGMVILVK